VPTPGALALSGEVHAVVAARLVADLRTQAPGVNTGPEVAGPTDGHRTQWTELDRMRRA
jgi:hypothetical protein